MSRRARAFTLIELMIVVAIIGVLMMMLYPAISSAVFDVKIKAATQHIVDLDICIQNYLQKYGDYPPSTPTAAWRNNAAPDAWAKPNYKPLLKQLDIASGTANSAEFDVTQGTILGGGLLNYFLMGPSGNGWDPQLFFCRHCGASKGIAGLNSPDGGFLVKGCNDVGGGPAANVCFSKAAFLSGTVLWVPPPAAEMLVGKEPIATYNGGTVVNAPFYYFEDGFPVGGACPFGGTIQYICGRRGANPYDVATTRCDITSGNSSVDSKTATDNPKTVGLYGTGISGASYARLLGQCKAPYALISSGPDRVFGYYYLKDNIQIQDAANGQSDEITNFPHD